MVAAANETARASRIPARRDRDRDARRKAAAAALSIASNSLLVALKLVAGFLTGSVAILTEAAHSAIDLLASVVAFVSVRKAAQPPDRSHPYGHEKVEHLAAATEGLLILAAAAILAWEAVHRLVAGSELQLLGVGIAVVALSLVVNVIVSRFLYRRAAETESPALAGDAAHLSTDALTSAGVLVALVLVEVTGVYALDAICALLVAAVIVVAGARLVTQSSRVLVDEALPDHELAAIRAAVEGHEAREVLGFHKLRARRAGSRRYIDMHVQFGSGTTLERAHELAHDLERRIQARLGNADVLIHLEPEASLRREHDSSERDSVEREKGTGRPGGAVSRAPSELGDDGATSGSTTGT